MSWGRSALGYVALAALIVRSGLTDGLPALALPIAVLLLVLAVVFGRRSARGYESLGERPGGVAHPGLVELAVAGALLAAVGGSVLVVAS